MAEQIRDRKTIATNVKAYMDSKHPGLGLDALACTPTDWIRMAANVAVLHNMLSGKDAKRVIELTRQIDKIYGASDALDAICRAAMSSRKRGDLRKGT